MDKISIIVPVYNGEKHLKECLDSIIHQEYKNLDIIVINDGSTDSSFQICQDYAERDQRIHLINQANQGRSIARNLGIELAQGSCIAFVDQDDYIWPNYISNLHQQICLDKTDIAVCDYGIFSTNHKQVNVFCPNRHEYIGNYTNREWLESLGSFYLNIGDQCITPWAKLFKKTCFKNVRFPNDRTYSEDVKTLWKTYLSASWISYRDYSVQSTLYCYRAPQQPRLKAGLEKISAAQAWEEQIAFMSVLGFKTDDLKKVYSIKLHQALDAAKQIGDYPTYNNLKFKLSFLKE